MSRNPPGSQARARYEAKRDHHQSYERGKTRWHWQSVRLDHEDIAALRKLAERKRVSVVELIRMAVTWMLEDEYGGADKD